MINKCKDIMNRVFKRLDINIILIGIIGISFAVSFISLPLMLDDYWYSEYFYDWKEGISKSFPYEEIFETWKHHWLYDNGRLANIFYVPFLLTPRWIGACVSSIFLLYSLYAGLKLVNIPIKKNGIIAIYMLMVVFLMPWYDSIGCLCYQYNYIISTAIAILVLQVFFKYCVLKESRVGKLLIIGIIAGAWHEGFSIPVLLGIIAVVLFYKELRTINSYSLVLGLTIGILWLLFAPGFIHRFDDISCKFPVNGHKIVFVLLLHPAFILTICTILLLVVKNKLRVSINPIVVALFIAAMCSVGIHVFSLRSPRAGWWGEFTSVLMLSYVLNKFLPVSIKRYNAKNIIVYLFVWIIIGLHMLMVDYYSVTIGKQFNSAIAEYRKNGRKPVFCDFITEYESPVIAMLSPDFTLFCNKLNFDMINGYWNEKGTENEFRTIPYDLRSVDKTTGELVAGNARIMRLGNHLYMPLDSVINGEFTADVDFGVSRRKVRFFYYPYVSDRDGMRYAYIYPWRCVPEIYIRNGSIKSINDIEWAR